MMVPEMILDRPMVGHTHGDIDLLFRHVGHTNGDIDSFFFRGEVPRLMAAPALGSGDASGP